MTDSIEAARPRVTVLVPTYNREAFLIECIESLLHQTLPAYQILVVNDGSTDETSAALTRFGLAIREIRRPQSGKAAAVNAGLPHVTGDYLWIFDDDDVALSDALERLTAPLEQHPEHGFSYTSFNISRSRPGDGRIGEILSSSHVPDVRTHGFLVPLLEANFLGGAALFARTSCYRQLGGFDPRLVRSQDYDMAIRMARAFTGIRAPGGPVFHLRQHEGGRGSSHDRFDAAAQQRKWLEYDQRIFRRLYRELPLSDYLPPGADAMSRQREALLQRMVVSASKLLFDQVENDLRALEGLPDRSRLNRGERWLVRRLFVRDPYYGAGGILEAERLFEEIGRLGERSTPMRQLRFEALRGLAGGIGARQGTDRTSILRTLRRVARMYRPVTSSGLSARARSR